MNNQTTTEQAASNTIRGSWGLPKPSIIERPSNSRPTLIQKQRRSTPLPEPLSVPWELRPASSAQSGVETLADGRKRYWVKHEVLKGVTPHMLAWWFANFAEGGVEIDGRLLNRYRVWHPFDHVYARYVRRAPDGSGGPGAQIALCEYLARNPRYKIEVVSTVEKVDETGFIHKVMRGGIQLVRMEHVFTETSTGTRDENCLIVPGSPRLLLLARILLPRLFPADKGKAWLKHSIEEVGTFPHFLPELYAREAVHPRVVNGDSSYAIR